MTWNRLGLLVNQNRTEKSHRRNAWSVMPGGLIQGPSICPHRKVPCATKPESVALLGWGIYQNRTPQKHRILDFYILLHGGMEKGRLYTLGLDGQPYFRKRKFLPCHQCLPSQTISFCAFGSSRSLSSGQLYRISVSPRVFRKNTK